MQNKIELKPRKINEEPTKVETNEGEKTNVEAEDDEDKKGSKKAVIWDWVKTLAIPIIVAILILQVIRPTLVQQQSMMPNVQPNNYLIVYKLAYCFGNEPEFGDIVVFKSELQTVEGKDKYLIKRVIATEGQTIQITDGAVYIDGEEINEPYLHGIETPGDVLPTVVPEDSVFVMGDNRANSTDSRDSLVGFVSTDTIMGKVVVRLFPFNEIGGLYSGDLAIE